MKRKRMNNAVMMPVALQLAMLVTMICCAPSAEAALQCFDCHGSRKTADIRPADNAFRNPTSGGFRGNHRSHLPEHSTVADCVPCHPGSDGYTAAHRDGNISLSATLNSSRGRTSYLNHSTIFPQSVSPALSSCSNVNCHFEEATPTWGSAPLAKTECGKCHGAPPNDGAHGKKHGQYFGTDTASCAKCHVDHTAETDPLAHARQAGKRGLDVRFTTAPNSGGNYSGDVSYPNYLPGSNPPRNGSCTNLYCHSDGNGRAPTVVPKWSDNSTQCFSCHRGRASDNSYANCTSIKGVWDSAKGLCTPYINMTSNGHARLVGPQWIRKYPCTYCHNATVSAVVDANGKITGDGAMLPAGHVNGVKDVVMAPQWNIVGKPAASYDRTTKTCDNVYCHSDGTTNPESIKLFAWTDHGAQCNTCHGHSRNSCSASNCHDGRVDSVTGKVWSPRSTWPTGQEWKAAIPMFTNQGPGSARANSHARHTQTNFTCDQCHSATTINGTCTSCHQNGIPPGSMSEVAHLNAAFHANKSRDVVFLKGGSYDPVNKTCSNTNCHGSGTPPVWGGSVTSTVICLNCHGITVGDVDSYGFSIYSTMAKINLTQWVTTGHGRPTASGPYPQSGNPAAGFPGNPCWYCHDNSVIHNDSSNPFRLRQHAQFGNRFEKECVYCHMTGIDAECLACHNTAGSLAPQLANLAADPAATWPDGTAAPRPDHAPYASGTTSCLTADCHYLDPAKPTADLKRHNVGAGLWDAAQKSDIRNQYMMMGVCLKCHDDDSGDKCTSCHSAATKYTLGFDPGTGFIKPQKAKASSVHFGYKHYRDYKQQGVWKGGKFCWDCHDPHGDTNIYMIHSQVATSTEGTFGIPKTRAQVSFTRKQSGLDYARMEAPYNGICNVCHAAGSQHYRSDGGDGHNASRVCTTCHEHRFTDSHADKLACSTCHNNKPVPRHSGFGLPRDCTKCHAGTVGKRMDVMGQMNANSHHVQGVASTNKHCYACHWEATKDGLIDVKYHEGYNYKTYSSAKNAKVDLVVWGPGVRPTNYRLYTTAVQFVASNIGTANERNESAKLTSVCLSCHSDQNNNTVPFNDCKTPRQYAWDGQSVAARYSQLGTTTWGKYPNTAGAAKKNQVKAFSAHGNAVNNAGGGWSSTTGNDDVLTNTRGGSANVQCFDCHSSHGSKVTGITSSYVTFNGSRNGGNLKETQAGKGGYSMSYKASSNTNTGTVNPYSAGAGQCFDCHETAMSGTTPWGYNSTFGASAPIIGYKDTLRFGQGVKASTSRFPYRDSKKTIVGGHLKASSFLNRTTAAQDKINGLCTPCHDPHGVSPTMGGDMAYGVPLLKGTWMTSPYKEDVPLPTATNQQVQPSTLTWRTDRNTFGGSKIDETDAQFAGLCLKCHGKQSLTDGTNKNTSFRSTDRTARIDRIHESVKGWGNNAEHGFTCSKCHQPHNSGLPRLMQTNCLDYKHRGQQASGGRPDVNYNGSRIPWRYGRFPEGYTGVSNNAQCHAGATENGSAGWPNNQDWNNVTPW